MFRDILARKRRTFLISTGIFIGVLGTIALFSMGDILLQRLDEDINNNDIAMLNTFVAAPLDTSLDNPAYLDYMDSILGLTAIEGSMRAPLNGTLEDGTTFEGVMHGYLAPFEALELEPLRLLEGDYPKADGEVAVEIRFAREHNLSPGDTLTVSIPDSAQQATLTIRGIVLHPYNLTPEKAIFAELPAANRVTGTNGFNIFSSRFADMETAERTADHLSAVILHDTPYTPLQYYLQDPSYNPLTEGTERISRTINLLAMIALVMSGFSVINVISKIVREQKQQIGLLKVMGASRLELTWIYMGIAFMYGLIGVIPGVLLGIPTAHWLAVIVAPEINTVITEFSISARGVGIGIALGLVIPVLSAIIPVLRGTNITILQAITDRGIDENYHQGPLAAIIQNLPAPITFRMGLHEVNKKKERLLLTIVALAVATGAFMGILAVFNGVNDSAQQLLVDLDTDLVSNVQNPYELTAALRMNVQRTVFAPKHDTHFPMRTFNIVQNADFYVPEGRRILAENEIIVSDTAASSARLVPNDTLQLRINDTTHTFRVVGIAPYPTRMIWIPDTLVETQPRPNTFTATLIASRDARMVDAVGFDERLPTLLTYTAGQAFSAENPGVILSEPLANAWGVGIGDNLTLQGAAETTTQPIVGIFVPPTEVETLDVSPAFVGMYWENLAIIEGYELPEVVSEPQRTSIPSFSFITLLQDFNVNLSSYQVLLSSISLLIALVGGLGLLTTLSLSVTERQREIGVMRSIGAHSRTIAVQFVIQGVSVAVIAWLLGLPLSVWIAERLLMVSELNQFFGAELRPDAALFGLAGVLVISLVASLWPALVAANSTVSDILRYH